MDRVGSCWIALDRVGSRWIALDRFGSLWIGRDRSGSLWIALDRVGSRWIALDRFGSVGIALDRSGSRIVGAMHSFLVPACALVLFTARSQALATSHSPRQWHAGRQAKASAKVGFGKHSDDSYQDVWETDPDYVQWVERTRSRTPAHLKFQSWIKRKAAGLDEDESMGGGQAILFDSGVEAANVVASSSDGDRNYGSLRKFWLARTGSMSVAEDLLLQRLQESSHIGRARVGQTSRGAADRADLWQLQQQVRPRSAVK